MDAVAIGLCVVGLPVFAVGCATAALVVAFAAKAGTALLGNAQELQDKTSGGDGALRPP